MLSLARLHLPYYRGASLRVSPGSASRRKKKFKKHQALLGGSQDIDISNKRISPEPKIPLQCSNRRVSLPTKVSRSQLNYLPPNQTYRMTDVTSSYDGIHGDREFVVACKLATFLHPHRSQFYNTNSHIDRFQFSPGCKAPHDGYAVCQVPILWSQDEDLGENINVRSMHKRWMSSW